MCREPYSAHEVNVLVKAPGTTGGSDEPKDLGRDPAMKTVLMNSKLPSHSVKAAATTLLLRAPLGLGRETPPSGNLYVQTVWMRAGAIHFLRTSNCRGDSVEYAPRNACESPFVRRIW